MAGSWLFHYTSREHCQVIAADGFLRPGVGGTIYLTWDIYDHGYVARQTLAIPGCTVGVVVVLDRAVVEQVASQTGDHLQPQLVRPVRLGINGRLVLRGGGAEILLHGPVSTQPLRVYQLQVP